MTRGMLTDKVNDVAAKVMGREITLRELRLMPYIQYVMMNEQKLDPRKINDEERDILSAWRKEGLIEGGASGMTITKKFWDAICEICFYAYVEAK